jgi:hypothetical protein
VSICGRHKHICWNGLQNWFDLRNVTSLGHDGNFEYWLFLLCRCLSYESLTAQLESSVLKDFSDLKRFFYSNLKFN